MRNQVIKSSSDRVTKTGIAWWIDVLGAIFLGLFFHTYIWCILPFFLGLAVMHPFADAVSDIGIVQTACTLTATELREIGLYVMLGLGMLACWNWVHRALTKGEGDRLSVIGDRCADAGDATGSDHVIESSSDQDTDDPTDLLAAHFSFRGPAMDKTHYDGEMIRRVPLDRLHTAWMDDRRTEAPPTLIIDHRSPITDDGSSARGDA